MLTIHIGKTPWKSRVLIDGIELEGVRAVTVLSDIRDGKSLIKLEVLAEAEISCESGSIVIIEREKAFRPADRIVG